MPPQVEPLDSDAALMLYASGEMPAAEREVFERRLAGDAALAAELKSLRAAQDVCFGALAQDDRETRLPVGEGVVVRRVMRAIHEWLNRRVLPSAAAKMRGLLLPWWCYPTAAAAAIIVAFLVWSSHQEVGPTPAVVSATNFQDMEQQQLADWMDSSLAMDSEMPGMTADSILGGPASPSSRADDLNSVFLMPPSEETIQ